MFAALFTGVAAAAPLDPAAFPSLGALADTGEHLVDTDAMTWSVGGVSAHVGAESDGVVVFTFDAVELGHPVTVVGSRPVAILSRGDLVVRAPITAAAAGSSPGPGGYAGRPEPEPLFYDSW